MKKLFYLLLFIPFGLFAQEEIINVGASANDGTGDPLRNAMIKINTNFTAVRDSFGNIYREPQTRSVINDTIEDRIENAIDIDDYLDIYGGAGSSIDILNLQFIIGHTTGAPVAGDSTITNSSLIGLEIDVYRDGDRQIKNLTATNYDNYRFNSTTGEITVYPPWQDDEQITIEAFQPVLRESLSLEGEESDLLTDLVAYYDMDESSGTVMNDALGVNNGVTTATVNQTGQIGKSYRFDTNSDDSYVPYNATLILTGDEMTVAMWIKLDQLPSTAGYDYNLAIFKKGISFTNLLKIESSADYLQFSVYNTTTDLYNAQTADNSFYINTWYHVAAVVNGTGNPIELYINGVELSVAPDSFTGTFDAHTGNIDIGNSSPTASYGMLGYMDELAIYNRALTVTEIQELMTKSYPFN